MGCFYWQKGKIKADQAEQHGPKVNKVYSNKSLVLPDADILSGEESTPLPVPSSQILCSKAGKRDNASSTSTQSRLTQIIPPLDANTQALENLPLISASLRAPVSDSPGLLGLSVVSSSTPLSSRVWNDSSPFRTSPCNGTLSCPSGSHAPRDMSHTTAALAPSDFSAHRQCPDSIPFSTPLPSRCSGDLNSQILHSVNPLPLCATGSSVSGSEPKRIAPQAEKKNFGGRPVRLPKPQANGHPLPLPGSREDGDAYISPDSGELCPPSGDLLPRTRRGKDGTGALSSTFRGMPMGINLMNAQPLPPPAFPTESRTTVRCFKYEELSQAFAPNCCIAEGPYGSAYWVQVDDGEQKKVDVAVFCPATKILQGQREWVTEINWLARLQDPHLCKLLGYSEDEGTGQDGEFLRSSKRVLIYEYLSEGSLQKHLNKRSSKSPPLHWATKMKIALDIAQGLVYLHNKAPFQVICRDFTSASIQLDKDFRAKISGFGLARSGPEGEKAQTSPVIDPYVAPESSLRGHVTIKSNVWSFGVILLELLVGRQHMDMNLPREQQNLVQLTKPFLRDESKVFHVIDPELKGKSYSKGVLKVASLAFNCLKKEPCLRPTLSEAVEVLKLVQIEGDCTYCNVKNSRFHSQSQSSLQGYSTPWSHSRSGPQTAMKFTGEHPVDSSHQKQDGEVAVSHLQSNSQNITSVSGECGSNELHHHLQEDQSSPQSCSLPVRYTKELSEAAVKLEYLPREINEQEPWPARLSVHLRVTCAPAVSFEPPMVREAF